MNIVKGIIPKPIKCVIYGTEGIGKSTFASNFPNPLFIDTEGSTTRLDVARTETPTSLEMLNNLLSDFKNDTQGYQTLVIDTIDWAEKLCAQSVCATNNKKGIEDFGYGKGYTYVYEEMGRILNKLNDIWEKGVNIVLTAHAAIRKFEQPDEMGAYDRWELKLINAPKCNICAMIKEWADMVLFVNYKTFSVAVDDKGTKHKAQGGARMMYTQHHSCWDAKNRFGLAEELPFDFKQIAHIFNASAQQSTPPVASAPTDHAVPTAPITQNNSAPEASIDDFEEIVPLDDLPFSESSPQIPDTLPKPLRDLMTQNKVDESEIRLAVSQRGYFPENTPIINYPPDFIEGVLIGAWNSVFAIIQENRAVPFT